VDLERALAAAFLPGVGALSVPFRHIVGKECARLQENPEFRAWKEKVRDCFVKIASVSGAVNLT